MRVWTAILTTCFFSLILLVLPAFQGLPAYLYFFQPEWLALTLSYWVLAAPERVGLMTAFLLGFAADLATGSPLGEHGLVYLMLVLFFSATYHQVRVLPDLAAGNYRCFCHVDWFDPPIFVLVIDVRLAGERDDFFEGFRKCANVALGIFAVTNDQAPSPLIPP